MLGLLDTPVLLFIALLGLVIAFTIHEWGHAYAAVLEGDQTPRFDGRLTLNPIKHIDPFGFLLIVLVGFGWAKPVITNPSRYKHKWGDLLVSSAGIIMNLLTALVFLLLLKFLPLEGIWKLGFYYVAQINVVLAVFNALPIPPLDGSHILVNFLPRHMQMQWRQAMYNQSTFLLLFVVIIANRLLGDPLGKLIDAVFRGLQWLVGGVSF